MKIKEKYSKFKLPDYDLLNQYFDIGSISEDTDMILMHIRLKMHEKIEFFKNIIEQLVQPDTNLVDMYEAKYFEDREETYKLFKKLMSILRKSNLISIHNDEKETIEFINTTFDEWKKLMPNIKEIIKTLSENWKKDTNIKNDFSYFG